MSVNVGVIVGDGISVIVNVSVYIIVNDQRGVSVLSNVLVEVGMVSVFVGVIVTVTVCVLVIYTITGVGVGTSKYGVVGQSFGRRLQAPIKGVIRKQRNAIASKSRRRAMNGPLLGKNKSHRLSWLNRRYMPSINLIQPSNPMNHH